MRFLFLAIFWLVTTVASYSQIPVGYYSVAIGKKKALLKTALPPKIKIATVLSYGGGDGKTWSGFIQTDVHPDGSVWDMYSSITRQFNGNLAVSGMNIEHSFAKSWWGGTETQAYKDLHHLNPSDATANQRKSSYPISIIDSTITYDNGVIKVGRTKKKPGVSILAWEPSDEYKGDFARAYMYMVTAYEDYAPLWTNDSEHLLDNNTYPVFEKWIIDILLDWTRQDPVSAKEKARNNIIYSIQGNRNPYIDYPLMAEYVWGNRTTMPFTENGIVTYPYLNYPNNNDNIVGQQIYLQQTGELIIPIKANNLTGALSFTLSGANAANYTLSRNSISKAEAESGTNLTVYVTGQTAAELKAKLTVSGGGIASTDVNLQTQLSDAFIALPATNISTNGFNANWTIATGSTGYQLAVYSLRPTGAYSPETRIEEDFTFALPNTWSREGYTDLATAGTMRLASTNNYGKVNLPPLNLSENGARITVVARQYSGDNAAKLTLLVNNAEAVAWTTAAGNQTFTTDIPRKTVSTIISFSAIAGKRVYVESIKVEELMPIMNTIPVSSFHVNGNFTVSYQVGGLVADSIYYYKVTPIGISNPTTSNGIEVRTEITTSKPIYKQKNKTTWGVIGNRLTITDLDKNSDLKLFDSKGRIVAANRQTANSESIPLPTKGIFILKINSDGTRETTKVIN